MKMKKNRYGWIDAAAMLAIWTMLIAFACGVALGENYGSNYGNSTSGYSLEPYKNYYLDNNGAMWQWYQVEETRYRYGNSCYPYTVKVWRKRAIPKQEAEKIRKNTDGFDERVLDFIGLATVLNHRRQIFGYLGADDIAGHNYQLQNRFRRNYANRQTRDYPTEAGTTVGGFIDYENFRFGDPVDTRRTTELAALTLDSFARSAAENSKRADDITGKVGGLTGKFQDMAGLLSQTNELKQVIAVLMDGQVKNQAMMATILREMKPNGEYTRVRSTTDPATTDPATTAGDDNLVPVDPPPKTKTVNQQAGELLNTYCASCHGQGNGQGRMEIYAGATLNQIQFTALAFRLNPNTKIQSEPDADGNTVPIRMPPAGKPQPTPGERAILNSYIQSVLSKGATNATKKNRFGESMRAGGNLFAAIRELR